MDFKQPTTSINECAGHSQRLLDYLVARGLLQSRLQTGSADALFWREVQALEENCQGRDTVWVRHIPTALERRLSGLPFDLDLPSVGNEGYVNTPQPLVQAFLNAMCRLANGLKRRDLDVFLLMQQGFDQEFADLPPIQQDVFKHERARLLFEADVFWATEAVGMEELNSWLSVYQLSRDMVQRGIVEVIFDD